MCGELGVVPRRWRRTAWQVAHIVSTSVGGILQGMRVLVVEDEARLALLLKRGLEEEGYAVDVTGDGAEALWLATEADYDAIVLDVMLPSLDGVEVTRRLRAGKRWVPVLLLTSRDTIDDRVAGQVAAYVGLCPQERSSGSSIRARDRIGPLGPAHLRKALFMPAVVAMRCNP